MQIYRTPLVRVPDHVAVEMPEFDDNGAATDGLAYLWQDGPGWWPAEWERLLGVRFPYADSPSTYTIRSEDYTGWSGYIAFAADIETARHVIASIIECCLTDEDVTAWHEGSITERVAILADKYGAFSIWGSRHGNEPLSVTMEWDDDELPAKQQTQEG